MLTPKDEMRMIAEMSDEMKQTVFDWVSQQTSPETAKFISELKNGAKPLREGGQDADK